MSGITIDRLMNLAACIKNDTTCGYEVCKTNIEVDVLDILLDVYKKGQDDGYYVGFQFGFETADAEIEYMREMMDAELDSIYCNQHDTNNQLTFNVDYV